MLHRAMTETTEETQAPPPPPPGEGTEEGERLLEAHRAFEAGDYRRVRELTEGLYQAPSDVADAARALHRRTEVDSMQVGVILACVVVFLFLVYMYVL